MVKEECGDGLMDTNSVEGTGMYETLKDILRCRDFEQEEICPVI
jgi:hypothetical protein